MICPFGYLLPGRSLFRLLFALKRKGDDPAELIGSDIFAGRGFDVIEIDVQGWGPEVLSGPMTRLLKTPASRRSGEPDRRAVQANSSR
jgi:hypothetical protein